MRSRQDMAPPDLATVRRLEALAFRAWPAASIRYDGSWLIRLTAGHPSKRLNSVNPLDPFDDRRIESRLAAAEPCFRAIGRTLTVRQTPLTPPAVKGFLDARGWERFGETLVMTADIPPNDITETIEHLPLRDVGRFVDARIGICGEDRATKAALCEIIAAIRPDFAMFVFEEAQAGPVAVSLAVHDNALAGLLQLAVAPGSRRSGIGAAIVNASLRWARLRGAQTAWLAVESGNEPAIRLYETFGFKTVYPYVYRRPATR